MKIQLCACGGSQHRGTALIPASGNTRTLICTTCSEVDEVFIYVPCLQPTFRVGCPVICSTKQPTGLPGLKAGGDFFSPPSLPPALNVEISQHLVAFTLWRKWDLQFTSTREKSRRRSMACPPSPGWALIHVHGASLHHAGWSPHMPFPGLFREELWEADVPWDLAFRRGEAAGKGVSLLTQSAATDPGLKGSHGCRAS